MRACRTGLLLLLASCADSPFEPYFPPASYRQWYAELQECSGLSGDFGRIRFEVADSIVIRGHSYFGFWAVPHRIIMRRDFADNEAWVKHELMHELLQRMPTGGAADHPAEYFHGACGELGS